MTLIKSLVMAMSLYTRIPMPQLDLKEGEGRYILLFFPLAGLIIFLLIYMLKPFLFNILDPVSRAILLNIFPILITGGIHLDGFIDVMDAVSSFRDREVRIEILKDPHIGAFSVIKTLEISLIWIFLLINLKKNLVMLFAAGFIVSRSLSGIAALRLKEAKNTGMLYFTKTHAGKYCLHGLFMWIFICFVILTVIYKEKAMLPLSMSLISYQYYKWKAQKDFGGITGDTEGCFLVMTETAWLFAVFLEGFFI